MSYRFRHLLKYCVRMGALHKVQHCRMSSASQLIKQWQSDVGSRRCRWRLRRVALRNTWGAGPVNAAMFKLKLKMKRCCTFYNITHPRWLKCFHINISILPSDLQSEPNQLIHVLPYKFFFISSFNLKIHKLGHNLWSFKSSLLLISFTAVTNRTICKLHHISHV